MEVDVVRQRVRLGVDQRQLDIVAFVHDHQRAGHRAIEGHGVDHRAVIVDDDRLFLDGHFELDDFGAAGRDLFVGVDEWRIDKVDLDARQVLQLRRRSGDDASLFGDGGHRRHDRAEDAGEGGGADQRPTRDFSMVLPVHFSAPALRERHPLRS